MSKWWLALIPGDKVFMPRERNKASGMAEVVTNGRKFITVAHQGIMCQVRKSDGTQVDYPHFRIMRSPAEWDLYLKIKNDMREDVDTLNAALRSHSIRLTDEHKDALRSLVKSVLEYNQ
ncbi:hypothetical protein [Enterobacter hormaechei]|uniref:hypothetical protein n=1 Tax=Enterobacter hormaechei TaxID=158836 RepID=UPI003D35EF2B